MPQGAPSPREGSEMFARKSKRELFLSRMEQGMPWGELLALMEPHSSPGGSVKPVGKSNSHVHHAAESCRRYATSRAHAGVQDTEIASPEVRI